MKKFLLPILAILALSARTMAVIVTLEPIKDNTLFEDDDGLFSSGAGDSIYAGRLSSNGGGLLRRALLEFDIASVIPPGATINSVTLTLQLTNAPTGAPSAVISIFEVTREWGEGTSISFQGQGGNSTPNDATWIHTFFNAVSWSNPGGDFAASASAFTSVTGFGSYTWGGAGMVADVQDWVNSPSSNHGWIIIGNESELRTAREFGSSENATTTHRPKLTINYVPEPGSASLVMAGMLSLLSRRRRS